MSPSGASFLTGNQNLETPTPTFWEKIVWGHLGSSRGFSLDHFKAYLGLLGPVVWILEGMLYPSATYQSVLFAW